MTKLIEYTAQTLLGLGVAMMLSFVALMLAEFNPVGWQPQMDFRFAQQFYQVAAMLTCALTAFLCATGAFPSLRDTLLSEGK